MIELPSLYQHQEDQKNRTRTALAKHGRVILNAPTGTGKTRMSKWILASSANREPSEKQSGRSLFTVHRRGLVDNAINSFDEPPKLPHGVIMSGEDTSYGSRIQVASIDTLLSWFVENDAYTSDITFDLIVFDESHSHLPKFAKFLKYHDAKREQLGLHKTYVIGLTATPQAKGLADVYKEIVAGPPTQWLVDNNYLSPFRYFRATLGQLDKLVKRGGEFTKDSEAAAMDGLAGDLVRDWKKYAEGRPTVGFFPRRSHAQDAMEELSKAGLRVEYVDGNTPDARRRLIFQWLNDHDIDYLCNVQVVERGTDIPRIGCVQLCVAVGSVVRYRQMIGRGSRCHPEKTDCLVIDHGNNVLRHGFFEDDPQWSLDITTKEPGEVGARPTIECPKCCVARGTMILTDRGEVPIQDVRLTDRVWDGVEFCCHAGITCNGIKAVIEWGSLLLTPDHEVLTHEGWKEAQAAKDGGERPVSGGLGGAPVRTTDHSNPYHPIPGESPGSRSGLLTVWKEGMAAILQNFSAYAAWMRALHNEVWPGLPRMACPEGKPRAAALSVSAAPCLQDLWWPRDRVSVFVRERGGSLDCGESWPSAEPVVDFGSHRQQWALRAGQLAMGDDADATAKSRFRLACEVSSKIPVRDVFGKPDNQPSETGVNSEANCGSLARQVWEIRVVRNTGSEGQDKAGIPVCEIQQAACRQADPERHDSETDRRPMVVEVWDIVNAGPRNRYTANGVIVSNCAIYRGGKCRQCGYEPTPRERRAQGLEFDGSELQEVKQTEKPAAKAKSPEELMVKALYTAAKSGRTWKQCVGIFFRLCEKHNGQKHRVPRFVTVGRDPHRYEMVKYGSDDGGRKVAMLYPFFAGNGHGGEYLVQQREAVEAPY